MVRRAWKLDTKLTAMMIEDCRHDPILATKLILRLKTPPNQVLRMCEMWTTHLTIDDSGFSTFKTYTSSILIALRSILFSGRRSGIVSGTFRQSQMMFSNIENWYNACPIVRYSTLHVHGQPKITHSTQVWEYRWKGGSLVRCLPPGFISGDDSQKKSRMRGERWHDGYFDEWETFDTRTLTRTLFGRVTAVNHNPDDPIEQNHIHLTGTPGFTSDECYEVVENIDSNIEAGSKDYGHFTSNWRHVPDTPEFRGFVDRRTIFTMQTTNPRGIVGSEIDGLWQKGSMSFYEATEIEEARSPRAVPLLKRTAPDEIFVAGFDSARGGNVVRRLQGTKGDDFSLSVLRIPVIAVQENGERLFGKPEHVYTTRANNLSAPQMAGIVYQAHLAFNLAIIVYDPGGGGAFVVDELESGTIVTEHGRETVRPITDINSWLPGFDPVLLPFKRGHRFIDDTYGTFQSDSFLINKVHTDFSNDITNANVALAEEWDGWPVSHGVKHLKQMRDWLNKSPSLNAEIANLANRDLAVCQLVAVDVVRRKDGTPVLDTHRMYKFTSTGKKDVAYGLLYAHCGSTIYKSKYSKHENAADTSDLAIAIGEY